MVWERGGVMALHRRGTHRGVEGGGVEGVVVR